MKNINVEIILRCAAVFLFADMLMQFAYSIVAPKLFYGFAIKPRPWFIVRLYLTQVVNGLFAPCLLLGLAEMLKIKKGNFK